MADDGIAGLYLGAGAPPGGHAAIATPEAGHSVHLDHPSGSIPAIVCDHVLERLAPDAGAALLREFRRVLQAGGRLRLATRDLEALVASYGRWRPSTEEDPLRTRCRMLNRAMRDDARWLYDREELARLARLVGLVPVAEPVPGDGGSLWSWTPPAVDDEPLVSVVITAFNPRYYGEALRSAVDQSYSRLEIVVGDDCPDDAIRRITAAVDDPRIRYTRNSPALGGPDNRRACFARARGSYIKFLNDDDLLEPDCVRRMAACLVAYPDVTLVTSRRRRIDPAGEPLPDIPATEPAVDNDARIDGASVVARVVGERRNFLGEPSTVMFRKAQLASNRPHILSFAGRPLIPNGDVTMWSYLLGLGDAVYLTDTLSSFRVHPEQMQLRPGYAEIGGAAWEQLTLDATELGLAGCAAPPGLLVSPLGLKPWWPETAIRLVLEADALGEQGEWQTAHARLLRALEQLPGDDWLEQLVASSAHFLR